MNQDQNYVSSVLLHNICLTCLTWMVGGWGQFVGWNWCFFDIIFVWQHMDISLILYLFDNAQMVGGVTFVEQEGNCAGKRQTPVEQKGWHTYM